MRRSLHSLSIPLAAAATFVAVYVVTPAQGGAPEKSDDSTYYPNCRAARAAGAAPIDRGEPGYRAELDRDGDGTACEPYRP